MIVQRHFSDIRHKNKQDKKRIYFVHNRYIYALMSLAIDLFKKYLIHTQVFVALMGVFLHLFFSLNHENLHWTKSLLIFITYINGYFHTKFQNSIKKKTIILYVNILSLLIGIGILISLHHVQILYKWLIIIILGLCYNSQLLGVNLRKIPLLKIFYVGFGWALVNTWLIFDKMQWGVFYTTWFYITGLIIPFDIRDIREDNIMTFPLLIGIRKSRFVSIFLLLMSLLSAFLYLETFHFLAFFISVVIAIAFTCFASETQNDLYFSFGVESCIGLPFLFLILMK